MAPATRGLPERPFSLLVRFHDGHRRPDQEHDEAADHQPAEIIRIVERVKMAVWPHHS